MKPKTKYKTSVYSFFKKKKALSVQTFSYAP